MPHTPFRLGGYTFAPTLTVDFRVDLYSGEPVVTHAGGLAFRLKHTKVDLTTTLIKPSFRLDFNFEGVGLEEDEDDAPSADEASVLKLLRRNVQPVDWFVNWSSGRSMTCILLCDQTPVGYDSCAIREWSNYHFSFSAARLPREDGATRNFRAIVGFSLDRAGVREQIDLLLPHTHTRQSLVTKPFQLLHDHLTPFLSSRPDIVLGAAPPNLPPTKIRPLFSTSAHLSSLSPYLATLLDDDSLAAALRSLTGERYDVEVEDDSDVEDEAAAMDAEEEATGEGEGDGEGVDEEEAEEGQDVEEEEEGEDEAEDEADHDVAEIRRAPEDAETERAASGADTLASPAPTDGGASFASPSRSPSPTPSTSNFRTVAVRTIQVPGVAYRTLHAVLAWTHTERIVFAPLRFSNLNHHDSFIKDFKQKHPLQPLPVSPRSVYRLAERLGLNTLTDLALEEYRKALTPSIVASLVLHPDVLSYPAIKAIVYSYIDDHPQQVEATSAWAALEADDDREDQQVALGAALTRLNRAKKALMYEE
ncbi:hypothetical protein JCM8097_006583 [Rhodosporidiobolus ruineniae]